MTREEFTRALALLLQRGDIDAGQLAALVELYDAGQLAPDALWLPASQAIAEPTEDDRAAALAIALFLAAGFAADTTDGTGLIDALQNQSAQALTQLSQTAALGDIATWHDEMAGSITRTIYAALFAAGAASAEEIAAAEETIAEQLRWLYLFAAGAAARQALGRPYSPAYFATRSRLYLGAARAQFYRAWERRQRFRSADGFVIDYIAVDDPNTCAPCAEAERAGPYLPGFGPMPGEICEGAGNCRCQRVPRFDPATAARLLAAIAA